MVRPMKISSPRMTTFEKVISSRSFGYPGASDISRLSPHGFCPGKRPALLPSRLQGHRHTGTQSTRTGQLAPLNSDLHASSGIHHRTDQVHHTVDGERSISRGIDDEHDLLIDCEVRRYPLGTVAFQPREGGEPILVDVGLEGTFERALPPGVYRIGVLDRRLARAKLVVQLQAGQPAPLVLVLVRED